MSKSPTHILLSYPARCRHGALGDGPKPTYEIDCRVLRNPHTIPELKRLNGRDLAVQDFVMTSREFVHVLHDGLWAALKHPIIGFYCFGGIHRSPAVACLVAEKLTAKGLNPVIRHLALEQLV